MKLQAEIAESETLDHPPLAVDAIGNRVAVPDGTAAWRICRNTAGRPRALTGPDGAAMRFPLTTTATDLVELCGADTYRVYALDEVGEVLEFVTALHLARPRNANAPDVPLAAAMRVVPAAHEAAVTSDLRFVLHALTEVARINGEALRSVTDSHADWIKTLAMSKGLPRNAAYPMLPAPRDDRDDESDEDERDEPDDEPRALAAPAADPMMEFLRTVTPLIPGLLAEWRGKQSTTSQSSAAPTNGMAHLARVQLQLDAREREFLAVLLADEDSGEAVAAELSSRPVTEVVAMIRERCPKARAVSGPLRLDAEQLTARLRERVPALMPRLSPAVQARLLALASKVNATALGKPAVLRKVAELTQLDDVAAAAWLEANLGEIETAVVS